MSDLELRPIERSEFPAFHRGLTEVFGEDPRDDDREALATLFEAERSLAVLDGGEVVATSGVYTRDLTVPGGPTPAAGVTMVSVQPTHRRRGLLTSMMRRQLTELHEQEREPVAALWASEAGIYARFGYGTAARQASWSADKRRLRLRADVPVGGGRAVLATPETAGAHETAVYEAVRPATVGWLSRPGRWPDRFLRDPEHGRDGASARRHVLWTEPDGSVTGYATYRTKHDWSWADNRSQLLLEDLVAATPEATTGLWAFLLGVDLFPVLRRAQAPLDDPLPLLVTDPRAVVAEEHDSLWVRLADVGRALSARAYGGPVDVVLGVRDEFCPWNAGTWRLSGDATGATCVRTTDAAEVTLSAASLGSVYLGGPTLAALAGAGLVDGRAATVAALSRAFAGERQPWCPEVF